MTYTTACKPGDIFYGRLRVEYKELLKIKVVSILITEDEGICYNCEYSKLGQEEFSSTWHFTEEDFKTLMFKTPEAAQKDIEDCTKLYELLDDSSKEIRFEENLKIARKLIIKAWLQNQKVCQSFFQHQYQKTCFPAWKFLEQSGLVQKVNHPCTR